MGWGTECAWDIEQDSSHTDDQLDTHSSSTDTPTARTCFICEDPTVAICNANHAFLNSQKIAFASLVPEARLENQHARSQLATEDCRASHSYEAA